MICKISESADGAIRCRKPDGRRLNLRDQIFEHGTRVTMLLGPPFREVGNRRSALNVAMPVKTATLGLIIIISLYPHTSTCKPGRTLKQILSGLLEFLGINFLID